MRKQKWCSSLFACRVKADVDMIRWVAYMERGFKKIKEEIMESLSHGKTGED